MTTPIAMTIAGTDSGGGAGVQADLKTFQELGAFGTSTVTAVTAQNTNGVHGVQAIDTEIIEKQLRAVIDDLQPTAAKTGMLFSAEIITTVANCLNDYNIQLVIDPVMIAKGGASLLQQEAIDALKTKLVPLATIITPNIPEAEVLANMSITTQEDIEMAAKKIIDMGAHTVIIKGGHAEDKEFSKDYILTKDKAPYILQTPRIDTPHTHGTGCTFSAAITAELAKGRSIDEAIETGKLFIQAAIQKGLGIGDEHGPTNHWAYNEIKDEVKKVLVRRDA